MDHAELDHDLHKMKTWSMMPVDHACGVIIKGRAYNKWRAEYYSVADDSSTDRLLSSYVEHTSCMTASISRPSLISVDITSSPPYIVAFTNLPHSSYCI